MAIVVIDLFEMVNIEEEKYDVSAFGQRRAMLAVFFVAAQGLCDLGIQILVQKPPVMQAGKRIDQAAGLQLGRLDLQLTRQVFQLGSALSHLGFQFGLAQAQHGGARLHQPYHRQRARQDTQQKCPPGLPPSRLHVDRQAQGLRTPLAGAVTALHLQHIVTRWQVAVAGHTKVSACINPVGIKATQPVTVA